MPDTFTCDGSTGGFSEECWYGEELKDDAKTQIAYRFQSSESDTYREVNFAETVWVIGAEASTANLATDVIF